MRKLRRSLLKRWALIQPRKTVERDGVRYALDCRELIDCDIYLGGWEPDTITCLRAHVKPGMTVLEVGSNVGAHTLILAQLVGETGAVHAVEPTEYAKAKLETSISLNPELACRVNVHQCLVSSVAKPVESAKITSSWQRGKRAGRDGEAVSLPCKTIDGLLEENQVDAVDFIKIDVDGYDLKALQGAKKTLSNWRPIVFVEICNWALSKHGQDGHELLDFMEGLGYRGFSTDRSHARIGKSEIDGIPSNGSIDGLFFPVEEPKASHG